MTAENAGHRSRRVTLNDEQSWQRTAAPVALVLLAVTVCAFAVGVILQLQHPDDSQHPLPASLVWAISLLAYPVVGTPIVQRHPRNPVGWLLLGIGLACGTGYALSGVSTSAGVPGSTGAALVYLLSNAAFQTGLALVALLLLVFPTGNLVAKSWRWVIVALFALLAVSLVGLFTRVGPVAGHGSAANPWAVPQLNAIAPAAGGPGFLLFGMIVGAAVVSVFLRFRRADDDLRSQLLWFALGAATLTVMFALDGIVQIAVPEPGAVVATLDGALEGTALGALAAAIAIAMLRHGLFDVDRLAVRSLGYGALAVAITIGYVAVVVLVGAALSAMGVSDTVAPFVAAAVIAVAFQPLRVTLLRSAARLVLGRRATPYQVLASTSRRVADTLSTEQALPAMARALAGATGGMAGVWLHSPDGPVLAALEPMPSGTAIEPGRPQGEQFDVYQGGEVLGVITIQRPKPLSKAERSLVDDLASQAGMVLRNALLSAELQRRLDELRSTAERLTSAAEVERRRLERDLHDGVQQQLTAITMKLGVARALAPQDPDAAQRILAELAVDTTTAMTSLRELSRGIFPPLLTVSGLRAALVARSRQVPIPVRIECPDRRFPAPVEAAMYFCCAEAFQNATKHSAARRVDVSITCNDREVSLSVRDDGAGFDVAAALDGDGGTGLHNMMDRFTALGGALRIESGVGSGTTIAGWIPLTEFGASKAP